MKRNFRLLCFLLAACWQWGAAQNVTILPLLPSVGMVTTNMVGTLTASNMGSETLVSIQVDVFTAAGQDLVLQMATDLVPLANGVNLYGAASGTSYGMYYGASGISSVIQQSGTLPLGSYNVCYTIFNGEDQSELANECTELEVSGASGPEIVMPTDGDTTTQCSPVLTWTPLMPIVVGMTYSLVFTNVYEGQTTEDALLNNAPMLSQSGLNQTMYLVNPATVSIVEGGHYAFQVQAVMGNTVLGTSEPEHFFYTCVPGEEDQVLDNSYKFALKDLGGGFYLVQDTFRFAYHNWNEDDSLDYELYSFDDEGLRVDIPSEVLPDYSLLPGNNYFKLCVLDFGNLMIANRLYIMRIKNDVNSATYSKFVFVDDE